MIRFVLRGVGASEGAQERRCIGSAGTDEIGAESGANAVRIRRGFLDEVLKQEFREPVQSNAMPATRMLVEPVGPVQEGGEGRRASGPDQRGGLDEPTAVVDQIPITGETTEALERREIQVTVLEYLIGWIRRINHLERLVVTGDRGAAQAFEDADLDLMGTKLEESVESRRETFEGFAGQPDDEIGVDVHAGFLAQEAQVGFEFQSGPGDAK